MITQIKISIYSTLSNNPVRFRVNALGKFYIFFIISFSDVTICSLQNVHALNSYRKGRASVYSSVLTLQILMKERGRRMVNIRPLD
jgi:hypothetical protein